MVIDKDLLEQFQLLAGMIQGSESTLRREIQEAQATLRGEIRESEARTKLFIENTVTLQIKGLFDGYQSALENQAVLRVANETLAKELDALKMRVAALESKTA